jgi:hypothetical protein
MEFHNDAQSTIVAKENMVPYAVGNKTSPILQRHNDVKSFENHSTANHSLILATTNQVPKCQAVESPNKEASGAKFEVMPDSKTTDLAKKIYTPLELTDMRSRALPPKTSISIQGMPLPVKPELTLPKQHDAMAIASDKTDRVVIEKEVTANDQLMSEDLVEKKAIMSEINECDENNEENISEVNLILENPDMDKLTDKLSEKEVGFAETPKKGGKKPFPYATAMKQWLDRTTS